MATSSTFNSNNFTSSSKLELFMNCNSRIFTLLKFEFKLLIESSEKDCVKVVNVEESTAVDQSPAIELAYLYEKMKFAEIRTIRAKQDETIHAAQIILGCHNYNLGCHNSFAYKLASGQIYDEMLQHLSGVSRVNLRKKTQLTKPIYILFSEIEENKIMRIKSYSANKLLKLTNMQIDTIKTTLREKNSCTHVTSEMITSDATAPAKSKVRIPIASTNSSVPVNSPVIPYDACTPYINVTLKEYSLLSLYNSDRYNDEYEFKSSGLCPGCEKEHDKGKVIG
ncbi:unnamed protein product [Rhizophagus irregularis]|nr:unnamed protein product [Rhizophagus irregularis]